jgi:hypothetical protein
MQEYLRKRYLDTTVQKILQFLDFPEEIDFRTYKIWIENFNNWHADDMIFFAFYCYDLNNDGLLC